MEGDPTEMVEIVETEETLAITETGTEITVVGIIEKENITITTETETEITTVKETEITIETEIMIETGTEIMVEGDILDVEDTARLITPNFASLSQDYHKDVPGKI